jgi:hypothetical protein
MTLAEVALVVSLVSAALSTGALTWSIRSSAKAGPTVEVSLAMGTQAPSPGGGVTASAVPARDWAKVETLRRQDDQHLFVMATNTGRAAVVVDSVGLCSGHDSATMVVVLDHGEQEAASGPTLPFRLHAGQSVRWAMPLSRAGGLCMADGVSDFGCIHGHLTLGNGSSMTTPEGARIGQVREVLTGMLHRDTVGDVLPDPTFVG